VEEKEMHRKLEDYTESEFLELLKGLCYVTSCSEREYMVLVEKFDAAVDHPRGNGIIYYPLDGEDDSPEGILQTLKSWRAENGMPGFKG
jgi:hypothetical protein